MTPGEMADAEQAAFHRLQHSRSADEALAAHKAWVAIRTDILDFVRRSGPIEHHASNTLYTLDHASEDPDRRGLTKRRLYAGRFKAWAISGSASLCRPSSSSAWPTPTG